MVNAEARSAIAAALSRTRPWLYRDMNGGVVRPPSHRHSAHVDMLGPCDREWGTDEPGAAVQFASLTEPSFTGSPIAVPSLAV